jgi:hypothetical protein
MKLLQSCGTSRSSRSIHGRHCRQLAAWKSRIGPTDVASVCKTLPQKSVGKLPHERQSTGVGIQETAS